MYAKELALAGVVEEATVKSQAKQFWVRSSEHTVVVFGIVNTRSSHVSIDMVFINDSCIGLVQDELDAAMKIAGSYKPDPALHLQEKWSGIVQAPPRKTAIDTGLHHCHLSAVSCSCSYHFLTKTIVVQGSMWRSSKPSRWLQSMSHQP